MSILRPSSSQMTRRLIVLATVVFAIAISQVQMFMGWGQTAQEFSAGRDTTLKVAGYAFAIWGVIYAGLLVYAMRQALPNTGESEMINRYGWPSILAFLGIGWWIVAAAFDWELATIVLIFGSLIVLLIPMLTGAPAIRALSRGDRDRWMTVWPLSLLAGWLTVAAPLNLITVATGNGDLPAVLSPSLWATIAIVAVVVVALAVTWRIRTIAYGLPIAWGLLGAFVAEQDRNMPLALTALAAAVIVLIGVVLLAFRLKSGIDRAV